MLGEISISDIFKMFFISNLLIFVWASLMSIYRSYMFAEDYDVRIDEILFNILGITTSFTSSLYFYTSDAKVFQIASAVFLCIHIIAAGFIYCDIVYEDVNILFDEILGDMIIGCTIELIEYITEQYILKKSEKKPEFSHDWCILDGEKVEYEKEIQEPDLSKMEKVKKLHSELIPRLHTRLIELGLCSVFWFIAFQSFLYHPVPFYSVMLILLSVMVAYAASKMNEQGEYGTISDLIAFLFEKVIYRSFYDELSRLKSEIYKIRDLYELPGKIKTYCKDHNIKRKDAVFLFDRYSEKNIFIGVCKKKHGNNFDRMEVIDSIMFDTSLYNATTIDLCDADKFYHNWFLRLHEVCNKMKKFPGLYRKFESVFADEKE